MVVVGILGRIHEGLVAAIGFLQEGVVLGVVVQSYPAGCGRGGEYLKGCGLGVGLGEYLIGCGRCGEYLKGCAVVGYLEGCVPCGISDRVWSSCWALPVEYCNYPMRRSPECIDSLYYVI